MKDVELEVVDKIAQAFKDGGYEGASLAKITEGTGLIKASLYHRFPGGKEEMAEAVMKRTDETFAHHILAPVDEQGETSERLKKVAARLKEFYADGQRPCLLNTLSIGEGPTEVRQHLQSTLEYWVSCFSRLAREAGMSASAARQGAEDAVAAIEGSLVLCRVSGSGKPFERALRSLSRHLGLEGK